MMVSSASSPREKPAWDNFISVESSKPPLGRRGSVLFFKKNKNKNKKLIAKFICFVKIFVILI
jgi:hypothetical protein